MKPGVVLIVFVAWLVAGVWGLEAAAPAGPGSGPNSPARQAVPASNARVIPQAAPRPAPALPSHYVLAVYFHRTQRCPTCRMIGAYVEQAIREGFAWQLQQGTVQFRLVDFEAPQNAPIAAAYRVTAPTLVIIDVRNGGVTAWQPLPQVWSLLARKDELFRYVQRGVRQYLEQ